MSIRPFTLLCFFALFNIEGSLNSWFNLFYADVLFITGKNGLSD